MENNIKIFVNIQIFKFGNLLGVSFYNSISQFPGHTTFSFLNYKNDNIYINNTFAKIKLFEDSSSNIFSFYDNIELINNIFGENIIKIRIDNFEDISSSGVILKSEIKNSQIYENDELELNDKLIFEPSITGAIPGEYYLYFTAILQEPNDNPTESLLVLTKYYGINMDYQSETIIGNTLRLMYIVECYEKCETCSQLGMDSNYYCVYCNEDFPYNVDNGKKCENECNNYVYTKENNNHCIENCYDEQFEYIKDENEKYCLDKCNENQFNYLDINNKKFCIDICNNDYFIYIEEEKYCLDNCENNQYKYINSENEKYCLNNCEDNQYEYINNENEKYCLDSCDDNQYKYINNENVKYCLDSCDENQYEYINNENEKYCLDNCDNDLFIYTNNENVKYCLDNCDLFIYVNNENEKYCKEICDNTQLFLYIKNENEQFCLQSCNNDLFIYIDNENEQYCIDDCNANQYRFIKNNHEKFCVSNCDNNQFKYIRNENEKYCLSLCTFNNEKLFLDEEYKICYNNCSENNNSKIYSYQNKCISQCPEKYNPNKYNICVTDEEIFEDNIKKLINTYNKKSLTSNIDIEVEIIEDKTVSCYSCNSDLNNLIHSYPNLMFINLKEYINILKEEYGIDENSDLLIITTQPLNGGKDFNLNNINYGIYTRNGEKITNLSVSKNTYVELSLPLNKTSLKNYEEALILAEQGYDIYNLSSEFYSEICLSAHINDSDLTLGLRQDEIYPGNESLCMDGCIYNGVDLEEYRVNCLCNMNLSENIEENENNFENVEEVEQNFFTYLASMINYQIIICVKIILDKKNYINNFGFYVNGALFLFIIISMFFYYTIGKKDIINEYFRKRPIINNLDNKKINKNNKVELKSSYKHSKFKNVKQPKKSINKFTSKSVQQITKFNNLNTSDIIIPNPNKKKKRIRKIKFITGENMINIKKRNNIPINKEISSGKLNLKNSTTTSEKTTEKSDSISEQNSSREMSKIEIEDSIDYNELPYFEAFQKDKRNIIKIFLSFFYLKIKTIQILFFRNEFTHFFLSFSFYIFEILLDITINSLLFSDDVISQKYYNNGKLLFITENILSIASNIVSSFILSVTEKLMNQNLVLDNITKEIKDLKDYYTIFGKLIRYFRIRLIIFYSILLFIGLFCVYYLLIFCAIYHKIQKNLFVNYVIGSLWSLGFTVFICLLVTITRKLSINIRNKRLYIISKFIDEKF